MSGKLFNRVIDLLVCQRFDRNKTLNFSLLVMQIIFKSISKIITASKQFMKFLSVFVFLSLRD